MGVSGQKIETDSYTEITVERADQQGGGRLLCLIVSDAGVRSISIGRLLLELPSGERVQFDDPLRFLDEVWTHGKFAGMREEAAK